MWKKVDEDNSISSLPYFAVPINLKDLGFICRNLKENYDSLIMRYCSIEGDMIEFCEMFDSNTRIVFRKYRKNSQTILQKTRYAQKTTTSYYRLETSQEIKSRRESHGKESIEEEDDEIFWNDEED